MKNLMALLFILILASCGQKEKVVTYVTTPPTLTPAIELLQGTWRACATDGANSTLVEFTFLENLVNERISQWDEPGCIGNETVQIEFEANVVIETETGGSLFHPGATDVRLHPNIDLFGCGISNPAYTFIKFTDTNYNQFNPALTEPACDSASRGVDINPGLLFIKQ